MPLFSVIIPSYNRAQFITATLDSVRAQEFTNYEVIVVDDGSTDDSLNVLRAYPEARVLSQANKGAGVARNYGVSQSSGRYIAFLDSDDIWFPWTLRTFADAIKTHKTPAILSARVMEFTQESQLRAVGHQTTRSSAFVDYFSACHWAASVGAGMAVLHRPEFLNAGGFTKQRINCEDHDLIMRMGTAAGFVRVLEPVTLGYRRHKASATASARATYEGCAYLLKQEQASMYPGGGARRRERVAILTTVSRSTSLECLRAGYRSEAWELYRATFRWHMHLGRWKYLTAFPLCQLAMH